MSKINVNFTSQYAGGKVTKKAWIDLETGIIDDIEHQQLIQLQGMTFEVEKNLYGECCGMNLDAIKRFSEWVNLQTGVIDDIKIREIISFDGHDFDIKPDLNGRFCVTDRDATKIISGLILNFDLCMCGECSKAFSPRQTKNIQKYDERVQSGDRVPDGECPCCGGLCYPYTSSYMKRFI
jgi:hypothetical protein